MTAPSRLRTAGFTLVELLLALTIGLVVLGGAMSLALTTWRNARGLTIRDGVERNARFIGVALQRDVQETGVDLASGPAWGSLGVWGDTITMLRVPYDPAAAPAYPTLSSVAFPNGVCGATCVEITTGGPAPQLAAGDLVRFQIGTERRLLLLTSVTPVAGGYRLLFTPAATLINRPAGIGGVAIPANGPFVQRLALVAYWRQGTTLMRAERLTSAGAFQGEAFATGVQRFRVTLIFTDGDELPQADGTDPDPTNNFDQIAGLRVRATLEAERVDPAVNGGVLLTRDRQWRFVPRNLVYERNRL
ncbi:MAG TPA: prepilin-type N-terminal cleavage/methylation domain-containing protein [Gemmatimonadales bacterium]|jgi:prepilin-type N-terminal cleavage/methylation domain-containing protein|nr:prepilin-type N-terminal cleavage/methylation domain-containing protein [Gemmatimonadales bacterium]